MRRPLASSTIVLVLAPITTARLPFALTDGLLSDLVQVGVRPERALQSPQRALGPKAPVAVARTGRFKVKGGNRRATMMRVVGGVSLRGGVGALITEWLIHLACHPKPMQEHRESSCDGDDRTFLGVALAA